MAFKANLITSGLPLPSDWHTGKVSDVADINRATLKEKSYNGIIEYIDITSVLEHRLTETQIMDFNYAPSRARRLVSNNDILISTVRPNLKHYVFIKKAKPNYVASTGFAIVSAKQEVESRYLYYYLTSTPFTEYLSRIADGGAYPAFNPSEISNAEIPLPPLHEQKAIASILGALDDKIELNRKMNETLEAMARVMFKSWFVDFDPIPGLGPHKEWQDSPLGKIPKGWMVDNLNEIVELHRDSISPISFPNEIFEHYSIPAFDDGQMPTYDLGSTIKSNKFLLPDKCILISKLNPRIPRIWFPKINKYRRAVTSTEFLVLVPKLPYNSEFIYSLCISASFWDTFTSLVTGTSSSHQRVKAEDLLTIKIACPSGVILKVFSEKVESVFKHIQSNKEQSLSLAAIRDALLPKLLSGEIRVKEAEGFVSS